MYVEDANNPDMRGLASRVVLVQFLYFYSMMGDAIEQR
jgi:hypothetical protein